jgi:hypothetical protein
MFFKTRDRVLALRERYAERSFNPSAFTQLISRQFSATDFSFLTNKNTLAEPNMIIVSGLYDKYETPGIEITLSYNPTQEMYFAKSIDWDKFSFDLAECMGHELVHKAQKKKFKPYISDVEEQVYLGDESEIDAYGFSIAVESITYNKPIADCFMYKIYSNIFDKDRSVVLKLEKQIVKYLNKQELI